MPASIRSMACIICDANVASAEAAASDESPMALGVRSDARRDTKRKSKTNRSAHSMLLYSGQEENFELLLSHKVTPQGSALFPADFLI
jgi:hypothetical protein